MEKAGTSDPASAPPPWLGAGQPPLYPQMPPMDLPPPYTLGSGFVDAQPPPPAQVPGCGMRPPPRVDKHVVHARTGPHFQQVTCGRCGASVKTGTRIRPRLLTYLLCSAVILHSFVWACLKLL